jgi:hypothetical protein
MTSEADGKQGKPDDAARAARFIAIKAAIFILTPAVASVVAVMVLLK